MSARKLGRFAGLVFVLVALAGGAAATVSAEQSPTSQASTASTLGDIVWT
ncbi:hypothetical protein [Symbioplanes lichenis]|nr:hypothetical protein [Actinoplanes lichenis]